MTEKKLEIVKPVSVNKILQMKHDGQKISMLTSYDYTMAKLVDEAGVDIILIGDSASNVMAGNSSTLPITLDEMIYHARSVARGAKHALVLCDMPFGSYQISVEDALKNAIRIVKESGASAVKLEGGKRVCPQIKAIIEAGIPVCGHLGLTPQSVNEFGGYGLRANTEEEADRLLEDALALEAAGCFAIVLEKIPATLAEKVTKELKTAATIGIGAGMHTDGQVLVCQDMLGMNNGFAPKFLRKYADLHSVITTAVASYVSDVKEGKFPSTEEQY